jgi:hypothetical protein
MTQPLDHDELRSLLDALCEGAITPQQAVRLEELVLSHPEAEALYVQYLSLQADLVSHLAALPCPSEQALEARAASSGPRRRRPWRGRYLAWGAVLGLAAAACLLALVFWPRADQPHAGGRAQPQPVEPLDDTVAVLVRAPEAVWADTELPTRPGAPLPPGWLRLKSGFAHLEFYSGAAVIVEGPAELRLVSRMEAYCARGRLRAVVPPHAQGFTIGSPKLDLVDRGTEFGLSVEEARTEVHVFAGQVDLYGPGRAGAERPNQKVTAGHGLRLGGGRPEEIAPAPQGFRTAAELRRLTEAEARKRHQDWLASSAAARKDERLAVYFPFDAAERGSRTLLDQARQRRGPHDGAIVGCSWGAGRWAGKRALVFKGVSDRVRLDVPGAFESLTLAAWVRIDGLPNRNNGLLMADGWEPGGVHWQILQEGTLVLGVQSKPKGKGAHYHAAEAVRPDRFGQWTHLAVVYDRAARAVTHYVDGEQAARTDILFDVPLRLGTAEVGNWNLASHRNKTPIRFFTGAIDELMVYSAALTDEEVARLYEQGRPGR